MANFDIEIMSLNDFGPIPEVFEDGETFEDNAVKKALFAARTLGVPAFADDSGLMVNAIGGMPGVQSARFAGDNAGDNANNLKLLKAMENEQDRNAIFKCVIAIAVPSGPCLIYEGQCEGTITRKLEGDNGFGYDPLFFYPPLNKTFAQMTTEEKNRLSHRGKAMAELRDEFDKVLIWLKQRLLD